MSYVAEPSSFAMRVCNQLIASLSGKGLGVVTHGNPRVDLDRFTSPSRRRALYAIHGLAAALLAVLAGCSEESSVVQAEAPELGFGVADPEGLVQAVRLGSRLFESGNLAEYEMFLEPNPGAGTTCGSSPNDGELISLSDHLEVVSNPRRVRTWVNTIAGRRFVEEIPGSGRIELARYRYRVSSRAPVVPRNDVTQAQNPQAAHMMIQLYDGREALWASGRRTLEAAIYWDLNAFTADVGKVKVYSGTSLDLVDTGITITPDTSWHSFELSADFNTREYISITVDGVSKSLADVPLASVDQSARWGSEVALIFTAESLAAWPQQACTGTYWWTQHYRDAAAWRTIP
jgi:hypothetical protein